MTRQNSRTLENLNQTEEIPVAPHEVRELLLRLTEQNTEGIRADEPRTLSGLALETGISIERLRFTLDAIQNKRKKIPIAVRYAAVALLLTYVSWVTFRPARPESSSAITIPSPAFDDRGLVAASSVTWAATDMTALAEETYDPPHPMLTGISVSLGVGKVLWGAGDYQAAVVTKPLTSQEIKDLREDIVALIEHARIRAEKRSLAASSSPSGFGDMYYDGVAYTGNLYYRSYHGGGGTTVPIPTAGKARDYDSKRLAGKAADKIIEALQQNMKFEASSARSNGP